MARNLRFKTTRLALITVFLIVSAQVSFARRPGYDIWQVQQTCVQIRFTAPEDDAVLYEAALWFVSTPEQRRQGLMGVRTLQRDQGMVFDFGTPQHFDMWMKNTLVPLDMFFVGSSGALVGVHRNAKPHDLTRIPSPPRTRYVVELGAGVLELQDVAGQIMHIEKVARRACQPLIYE